MAKKKKESVVLPREAKRQPGYYEMYFGGKCIGSKLDLDSFLQKYFINLDKNLTPESNLEELLDKYKNIWKTKGDIWYVDSWGHRWNEGPSKTKLLNYLNEYSKKV